MVVRPAFEPGQERIDSGLGAALLLCEQRIGGLKLGDTLTRLHCCLLSRPERSSQRSDLNAKLLGVALATLHGVRERGRTRGGALRALVPRVAKSASQCCLPRSGRLASGIHCLVPLGDGRGSTMLGRGKGSLQGQSLPLGCKPHFHHLGLRSCRSLCLRGEELLPLVGLCTGCIVDII